MRLILVQPNPSIKKAVEGITSDYEIVKSAGELTDVFRRHDGFFDGIIAPSNPDSRTLRAIGENPYVKQRDLPIFVHVNTTKARARVQFLNQERFRVAYRGKMSTSLKDWVNDKVHT